MDGQGFIPSYNEVIHKTIEFVKNKCNQESSGHDWWHVYRVWKTAQHIMSKHDSVDNLVIELTALLHDIADWKKHNGDFNIGPNTAKMWLKDLGGVSLMQIDHICYNIKNLSFKGINTEKPILSLEGQIVQDADRLDAMGAIGIARTFTFGGHIGRQIFSPDIPYINHKSEASYVHNQNETTSINHFYEKLLLIKDLMNTVHGKELAQKRHDFITNYLSEFYLEWEGNA